MVGLLNVTPVVEELLQTTWFFMPLTAAVGFTVIVNVFAVPVHVTPLFVYDGVTVIVAIIGELVVFVTVNAAISPVPLAAKPMLVVLFVQL